MFPDYQARDLRHLKTSQPKASGSTWDKEHLEALRVLLIPSRRKDGALSILQHHMNEARAQLFRHQKLVEELSLFKSHQIGSMSHSELWQSSGRLVSFY